MPKLFGRGFTRRDLARQFGDSAQIFGVRLVTAENGAERGVRMLQFNTGGGFRFDVMVDRCMDIGGMWRGHAAVGWHSPTGFRNPWLHEVDAEGGLGFLRSFSGFMNTCGFDHVMGQTEEDAEHYDYPYRAKIFHGIHGRASYIPAQLIGYGAAWDGDDCTLWAEAKVRQATMFGENLELTRRIEAKVGGNSVTVRDRVENVGFLKTPHMLLYHVNIGWPVLDEGAEIVAPVADTVFYAHDTSLTDIGYRTQPGPQAKFREQVYEHDMATDGNGIVPAALVNRGFDWGGAKGLAFLMEYRKDQLPALWQWQNLQEGNYVMGIEPATIHAGTRQEHKDRGEVRWLEHGDGCDYELTFSALAGEAELQALDDRVAKIGG